jgi:hypothetical protein
MTIPGAEAEVRALNQQRSALPLSKIPRSRKVLWTQEKIRGKI